MLIDTCCALHTGTAPSCAETTMAATANGRSASLHTGTTVDQTVACAICFSHCWMGNLIFESCTKQRCLQQCGEPTVSLAWTFHSGGFRWHASTIGTASVSAWAWTCPCSLVMLQHKLHHWRVAVVCICRCFVLIVVITTVPGNICSWSDDPQLLDA